MAKATGKVKPKAKVKTKPVPPSARKIKMLKGERPSEAAMRLTHGATKAIRPKVDVAAMVPDIQKMREEGMAWDDIREVTGVNVITMREAVNAAAVRPKDRIKGTDSEIAKAIVRLRDKEHQSLAQIAARTGLTKVKVANIYTEQTGNDIKTGSAGMTVMQARAQERADNEPVAKPRSKKAAPAKVAPRTAAKAARAKRAKAGKTANPS